MPLMVCTGATLQCSFGLAPGTFNATGVCRVNAMNKPAGTFMDNIPMTNVMPFGNCTSLANPTVSAATTAAQGVLTPMPCIPILPAGWVPGSPTVTLGGKQALNMNCNVTCQWGGIIQIINPGQTSVNVP